MTEPLSEPNSMNRREFGAVWAAVALVATGSRSMPETPTSNMVSTDHRRVGICDEAYNKAWKRAAAWVAKMTLDEKISQTGNNAPAIKRIGLPAYQYYAGEALHGLRRLPPVTLFPVPAALGCTWNRELIRRVFHAVSDEARAYHNTYGVCLTYYSPSTLNITRDPRWGRCQEVYGEDPCHLSSLAVESVRGMQGENPNYLKTTACAKALICNNTENDRLRADASVDSRSFWEYYTRAYRACVMDGDVLTMMGAYNAINGVPCCADHFLLTHLLRDRWGFRGYVVSDCDAIAVIVDGHHYASTLHQAAALGIQAGCDQNCGYTFQQHLRKAVDLNLVSEADIGRAVVRALTVRFLLGEFDRAETVPYKTISMDVVDSPMHRALALEAARQSVVLLKNDNHLLPLNKSALQSVAIIGPTAGFQAGSYAGFPAVHVSPLDGIAAALGVDVSRGLVRTGEAVGLSPNLRDQGAPGSRTNFDFARIPNGSWMEFPPQDFTDKREMVIRVASLAPGGNIAVHLDGLDGPLAAKLDIPSGGWHIYTDVSAPLRGITGSHKVFLRFSCPAGTLFKVHWFELLPPPPLAPRAGRPKVVYHTGCGILGEKDEKAFWEAVRAAREADVAILVCGIDQSVDCEGMDRHSIDLTGPQHELIRAVHAANPQTVLVLNTNNSVAINWEKQNIPAIVCSLFAGQAQGTAIADVLFGNYNPCGKLPTTWFQSVDQLPPFHNYDVMRGRTYMYFEGEPLYPFGYGLSYTQFKYSDLKISAPTLGPGGTVSVSAKIHNTGGRAGAEVVQFYITAPKSPVKRPSKQLAGFARIELKAGASKTVIFTLPFEEQALWYWHEKQRRFVLAPGILKVMLGRSAADIPLHGEVTLEPAAGDHGGPEMLPSVAVAVRVV